MIAALLTRRWLWYGIGLAVVGVALWGFVAPYVASRVRGPIQIPPEITANEAKDAGARKKIQATDKEIKEALAAARRHKASAARSLKEADEQAARNRVLSASADEVVRRRAEALRPSTIDEALAGLRSKGY